MWEFVVLALLFWAVILWIFAISRAASERVDCVRPGRVPGDLGGTAEVEARPNPARPNPVYALLPVQPPPAATLEAAHALR